MSHGADRSSLLLPITTGHPGSFHPLRDIMPMQLDNPSSNSNRPTPRTRANSLRKLMVSRNLSWYERRNMGTGVGAKRARAVRRQLPALAVAT